MTEQNISCLLYGPGKAKFEHRPIPELEDPHDVLVRVSFVGVCGSDVHFWMHGGITRKVSDEHPLVMGHEAAGIIHTVGPAVTSVKPGDRVAIEPGFPCRRCKQCKKGRYNLCPKMHFAADPPHADGALARYFKIPEDFCYKIPDGLGLDEAVLVEPLSVAVHTVRLAEMKPGQEVLVLGSGTIGLLSAAVAKAFGAKKIVIVDIKESKLEFAKNFVGCATVLSDIKASPEENAEKIMQENGLTEGFDVTLECTGVESSAQTGIYALGAGGMFVQAGMGKPLQAVPVLAMNEKEIVYKGAFRYSPGDYELALDLLQSGKVSVKSLISSTVPFEQTTEAWERTRRGEGIKNLIQGVQD